MRNSDSSDSGVIIEFSQVGTYVKVSAFHEASMTEVSIVGDPRETKEYLQKTILKKLAYVLNKSQNSDSGRSTGKNTGKRGIIV